MFLGKHQFIEMLAVDVVLRMSLMMHSSYRQVYTVAQNMRVIVLYSIRQITRSYRKRKKKISKYLTSSISFGVACLLRDATNNLCSMAPKRIIQKTDEVT
jgi:hypothetical protein